MKYVKNTRSIAVSSRVLILLIALPVIFSILRVVDGVVRAYRVGSAVISASEASEPQKPRSYAEYLIINDCITLEDGALVCGSENQEATLKMEAWKSTEYESKKTDALVSMLNFSPEKLNPEQSKAYHTILSVADERGWKNPNDIAKLLNVAWCESKLGLFRNNAKNNHPANSIDRGLFMWNNIHNPHISDECAYDYACATNEAISAWNIGQSWKWVCMKYI